MRETTEFNIVQCRATANLPQTTGCVLMVTIKFMLTEVCSVVFVMMMSQYKLGSVEFAEARATDVQTSSLVLSKY